MIISADKIQSGEGDTKGAGWLMVLIRFDLGGNDGMRTEKKNGMKIWINVIFFHLVMRMNISFFWSSCSDIAYRVRAKSCACFANTSHFSIPLHYIGGTSSVMFSFLFREVKSVNWENESSPCTLGKRNKCNTPSNRHFPRRFKWTLFTHCAACNIADLSQQTSSKPCSGAVDRLRTRTQSSVIGRKFLVCIRRSSFAAFEIIFQSPQVSPCMPCSPTLDWLFMIRLVIQRAEGGPASVSPGTRDSGLEREKKKRLRDLEKTNEVGDDWRLGSGNKRRSAFIR